MQYTVVTLALVFSLHTISCLTLLDTEWHSWKARHGVVYQDSTQEGQKRRVWEDNYHFIEEHNKGNQTYKLGLNRFADLVRAVSNAPCKLCCQTQTIIVVYISYRQMKNLKRYFCIRWIPVMWRARGKLSVNMWCLGQSAIHTL